MLLEFIGPLAFVLAFSCGLSLLFGRKVDWCFPLTFFISGLLLYVFALFGVLSAGYVVVAVAAVACLAGGVAVSLRRQAESRIRELLATPGAAVFLLLYLGAFIITLHKGFTVWDEISHWGQMVQETLRTGVLYSESPYLLVHRDYPPAITLLECLWCKLSGGAYAEHVLYRALWMFCFSLFIPFLEKMKWERSPLVVARVIYVALFIAAFNAAISQDPCSDFFRSIYIDCALGLLLSYGAARIIIDDFDDVTTTVELFCALAFLALTKQMGVVFALFLVVLYLVTGIIKRRRGLPVSNSAGFGKLVVLVLPVVIAPVLAYLSWKLYTTSIGVVGSAQFHVSDIRPDMLFGIIQGSAGEEWQHVSLANYANRIIRGNDLLFGLNYISACVLAGAVLIFSLWHARGTLDKGSSVRLCVFFAVTAIVYAIGIGLLYTFSFGPEEGPILTSYSRYMGTIVYSILATAVMALVFADAEKGSKECVTTYLSCIIALALVPFGMWKVILGPVKYETSALEPIRPYAEAVIEGTEEGSSVFLIADGSDGFLVFALTYLADPRIVNLKGFNLELDESSINYVAPEDFGRKLASYDYLYFQNVGPSFKEKGYADAIDIDDDVESGQIYKLSTDADGRIRAELVNQ